MKEDPTLASAVCERGGVTDRSCHGCYWHYSPGVRSQAAPKAVRQNVHLVDCLKRSVSCRGDLQGLWVSLQAWNWNPAGSERVAEDTCGPEAAQRDTKLSRLC